MKHGADDGFVYPTGKLSRDQQKEFSEQIKQATGGKGADVLYDPVGGDYAEPAVRAMNWEGRYLVIGFAAGIPSVPLNLTLLKSCDIQGVFWGAFTARDPKRNQEHLARDHALDGGGKAQALHLRALSAGARGRGHPHAGRPQGPGQSRRDDGMSAPPRRPSSLRQRLRSIALGQSARPGPDHRRGRRRSERHRDLQPGRRAVRLRPAVDAGADLSADGGDPARQRPYRTRHGQGACAPTWPRSCRAGW